MRSPLASMLGSMCQYSQIGHCCICAGGCTEGAAAGRVGSPGGCSWPMLIPPSGGSPAGCAAPCKAQSQAQLALSMRVSTACTEDPPATQQQVLAEAASLWLQQMTLDGGSIAFNTEYEQKGDIRAGLQRELRWWCRLSFGTQELGRSMCHPSGHEWASQAMLPACSWARRLADSRITRTHRPPFPCSCALNGDGEIAAHLHWFLFLLCTQQRCKEALPRALHGTAYKTTSERAPAAWLCIEER